MQNIQSPEVYDKRSIQWHWLSAALVIGLWAVGQCIDFFPKGDPRVMVRSMHIAAGTALAIVLVLRLSWRRNPASQRPPAEPGVAGKAAVGAHHLLYLLMAATVVVGLACVWIRGDNLFNLFTVPAFDPANKELRHEAVELHETLANSLLILAGLHAASALFHHLVRKDGVLRRMLPGLRQR